MTTKPTVDGSVYWPGGFDIAIKDRSLDPPLLLPPQDEWGLDFGKAGKD
jgi:hypothetical protein